MGPGDRGQAPTGKWGILVRIRRVIVERFRGIEFLELFPALRTVLVGPNNSGKSTILEALDLLLHSGVGRPRPGPAEIDYFDRDTSQGFRIEAVLGDLDPVFVAEVHDALEGWKSDGHDLVPEPDGDGIEAIVRVEVRGTADLELVHSFAKPELAGLRFGRALRTRIGWVFDGRTREPSRQLAFYQGGLLDQLFAGLDLGPAVDGLRAALDGGAEALNEDPVVSAELVSLEADLRSLGLLPVGSPAFEGGAITQRELLQALRLAMPGHGAQAIPLLRQGRGAQRLTVLAILLRLARAQRGPMLIGAFEEPEEALEPLRQAQAADMLTELAASGGQVFVTTHSPDVIRAFSLGDIMLISPGARPTVCPLATALSGPARYGLERRIDTALTRALFVPVPLVGEGPSDKVVFDTFWNAMARDALIPPAEHVGLEPVNAEGVTLMPLTLQILREAGKDPVAWVERDDARSQIIIDQGFATCILLYPDDEARNNLERLLSDSFTLEALGEAMAALASDRGDGWPAQLDDMKARASSLVPDRSRREALAAARNLPMALACLEERDARRLVAACIGAKSAPAPFEIKGTRSARIFAETLVARGGVADPFARAFRELATWIAQPPPRPRTQIEL